MDGAEEERCSQGASAHLMGQPESKPLFSSPLLPGPPQPGSIPPAAGKSEGDGASEDEVQDLGVFRPASGITTLWVAELEQHKAAGSDQSAVPGTDVESFSTKLSSSTPDYAKMQDSVSNAESPQGQPDEEIEGRQAPGGVNSGDWYSILDKVRLDTMPPTPPRLHWNLVDSVVHTMMKNPEEKEALIQKPHPDADSNPKEKDSDLLPGSKYGQSTQEQVREKRLQDIERMKEKLDQALRRSSANIKASSAPATDPTGVDKEDSTGKEPLGIYHVISLHQYTKVVVCLCDYLQARPSSGNGATASPCLDRHKVVLASCSCGHQSRRHAVRVTAITTSRKWCQTARLSALG